MKLATTLLLTCLGLALVPAALAAASFERAGRHGAVIAGTLAPGAAARHGVRLREGELLTVSLHDADGGELADPVLGVFAPSDPSQPVASDDDGGPGFLPRLALRAAESGLFTIAVSGFGDDDFDGSGHREQVAYRLVLAVESDPARLADDERGRPLDMLPLRRGAALVSGSLVPGDVDAFELSLDPGAALTVSLFEPERGVFHDPVLRLVDDAGRVLAANDDGGPGFLANLAFETPGTGRARRPLALRLEVDGFDPDGDGPLAHAEDFAYQLVISIDRLE
jgi:hypothetical protein